MRLQEVFLGLVFFLIFPANIIGLWWAVGNPLVMDRNHICKSRRLGGKQRQICDDEPEIVEKVVDGAKVAIAECQYQFRNRKWNCPTEKRALSKVLRLDTRESAFVHSITSAGVVHAVTQACSMGTLLECTCARSTSGVRSVLPEGEWEWGGCHDDVKFGYKKSKQFLDVNRGKKRSDIRTKLQLHNTEAGRLSIKRHMRTECKCHGLSGSCEMKTCWQKMPVIRNIGQRLKEKFDGAAHVQITNDGTELLPVGGHGIKAPDSEDLVYSELSPDYCVPNKKIGSLGTSKRTCDPKGKGVEGCDLLCCGRGYTSRQITVHENCKCRFRWCCEVVCESCVTIKTIAKCR